MSKFTDFVFAEIAFYLMKAQRTAAELTELLEGDHTIAEVSSYLDLMADHDFVDKLIGKHVGADLHPTFMWSPRCRGFSLASISAIPLAMKIAATLTKRPSTAHGLGLDQKPVAAQVLQLLEDLGLIRIKGSNVTGESVYEWQKQPFHLLNNFEVLV